MSLWLPPALAESLIAQAQAAAPREFCGLLLGQPEHAASFEPVANVAAQPERAFRMDERTLARLFTSLPQDGRELLALVHSHPQGDPRPSARDIAEAAFPGTPMLIVGLKPRPALAAWSVRYGEVTPVELHIRAARPAPVLRWTTAVTVAIVVALVAAVVLFLLITFSLLPPPPQIPPTPMPR